MPICLFLTKGKPTMTEANNKFISMRSHGPFLGTRFIGNSVRAEILIACDASDFVIVDFTDVNEVSHSFIDECFGGLVDELGPNRFRKQIRFKDVSDDIAALLRLVTTQHARAVSV